MRHQPVDVALNFFFDFGAGHCLVLLVLGGGWLCNIKKGLVPDVTGNLLGFSGQRIITPYQSFRRFCLNRLANLLRVQYRLPAVNIELIA